MKNLTTQGKTPSGKHKSVKNQSSSNATGTANITPQSTTVWVVLLLILAGVIFTGMVLGTRSDGSDDFARLEHFKMLLSSFFPLALLILAVLGSIVFGLATPSEAAAAGALGGLLLAAAYGQFNYPVVRDSVFLTAKTSAMVCWLFVGASIFSASFALLGGQEIVERWVTSLGLTPIEFLLLSQVSSSSFWAGRSSGPRSS